MLSLTALLAGLLVGLRHALEPDHLAAVTTLVPDNCSGRTRWEGVRRSAWLGASWGLGHGAVLALVVLPLSALGTAVPRTLALSLELLASCFLLLLGAQSMLRAMREGRAGGTHPHVHGGSAHEHVGPEDHLHLFGGVWATRPLVVGAIHGLAGSGALTAVLLTQLPSAATRALFLSVFVLGGIVGMTVLTGALGPAAATMVRQRRLRAVFGVLAGLISIAVGLEWLCTAAADLAA